MYVSAEILLDIHWVKYQISCLFLFQIWHVYRYSDQVNTVLSHLYILVPWNDIFISIRVDTRNVMEFLCVLWIGKYIVVMDTLQSVRLLVSFFFNSTFLDFVSYLGNVQVLERLFCETRHFKTCCANSFLFEPNIFNFWFQYIPENPKILVQDHFMGVNNWIV